MEKKIKVLQLKILLVIMEILLVLLIWTLLQLVFLKRDEVAERFHAQQRSEEEMTLPTSPPEPTALPESTPLPFSLRNFDKIRVVITNQETGGIYHKNADTWENRNDYRGVIEIVEESEGFVVINELPIEEYLYSVVPSEMPATYPIEALKAQAICARTYAYLHVMSPGYPEWNAHVDDSTAYQVYHSVGEQETTTKAVNETQRQVLFAPGEQELAQTYYYSTSCGYGSDAHVWRTKYSDCYPYIQSRHINAGDELQEPLDEKAFEAYLDSVNELDYEVNESWYRWDYSVEDLNREHMEKVLQKRYAANEKLVLTKVGSDFVSQPIEKLGNVTDLQICKREAGGVADELLIYADTGTYKVITELNIRYVLNDGCSPVNRQDGVRVEMNSLLPSGFIVLKPVREDEYVTGYQIRGGGFGHGAGMSQNAAKAMANAGMCAEEILSFFFENCVVRENF